MRINLSRFAIIAALMAGILLWIGFETNLHFSLSRESQMTQGAQNADVRSSNTNN